MAAHPTAATPPTVSTPSTMIASTMTALTSPSLSATEPLNLFARLPAELRHIVYGHLGYPVGKHLWIDCPGHPVCQDNSHIVDHRDADWPMSWHALTGVFEIRVEVKQVVVINFHVMERVTLGPVEVRGVMKWANGKETATDAIAYISASVLGVNKEVRHEVLSLLLSNYEIRFAHPLFRHRHLSASRPVVTLHPSTFGYMISVTLDQIDRRSIGHGSEDTSILFLAEHCSRLRYITVIISASFLQMAKPVGNMTYGMAMVQALRVLTVQCKALEKVTLGSPVDSSADLDAPNNLVVVELGKAGFGGVVLWAWETLEKFRLGEAVEDAVAM